MNAHQRNRILPGNRRHFRLNLRRLLRLHEFQKAEQSVPLKPVKLPRQRE